MAKTVLGLIIAIFTTTLLTSSSAYGAILTPEDNDAKQKIVSELSNQVNHKYDRYDLIIASVKGDNSSFVIINQTGEFPIPPVICGEGTVEEDGVCIPEVPPEDNQTGEPDDNQTIPDDNQTTPEPEPEPTPEGNKTTLAAVGDIRGSEVPTALDKEDYDHNVALGDMGYKSSLTEFKGWWDKLNEHACVIGNHDSDEDGASTISKQAREYCTDIWMKTIANGTTMLIGFNTNGNLDTQLGTAQEVVMNEDRMEGIKNVITFSHKPCATHPNSHHGIEGNVKTLCESLRDKIPEGVNFVTIAGHNHESASKADHTAFIAGGGGATFRSCGTGSGWDFCNNEDKGWLELTIDNDSGDIDYKFIKTNGDEMN